MLSLRDAPGGQVKEAQIADLALGITLGLLCWWLQTGILLAAGIALGVGIIVTETWPEGWA